MYETQSFYKLSYTLKAIPSPYKLLLFKLHICFMGRNLYLSLKLPRAAATQLWDLDTKSLFLRFFA